MLNSQASSAARISVCRTASFASLVAAGLGIAVSGCVQSPLATGNGVNGNGFVLAGVLGGLLLVGRRVRLILASLGRRLYATGARVAISSSGGRPWRREAGGAKGVTGDIRSGSRALPWNGPVVERPGMVTERLFPLWDWMVLALRD